MHKKQLAFIALFLVFVVAACSTERNTLLSRTYHGTTAHYNGYFNANDLLKQAIGTYRDNLKEDFYRPLIIRPLPSEEEVMAMYAPIDTAIAKCTKVIQRHAMPGTDKPSKKKEEHNRWIDENWITIGIANYYRRDYELALKNFEYVQRFFSNDPSTYTAEVWKAKTYIQQENFTEANFSLDHLDKAVKAAEGQSKSKSKSRSKSKSKSSKKDDEEPPAFPKKLRFELELTRAQLAEKKGDKEGEIKALEASLEFAKKSADKARIHFILGQLYEATGKPGDAAAHYDKALKYNGGYEMNFNARLKRALNGGTEKVKQDLQKMLRDEKNREFRDQIYYTLALISQQEGNEPQAIGHYTNSALYSLSNPRQKGMSFEKLGDLYFNKKDYVRAQKYYDSCAKVIPENYPNAEGVRNKAAKLQDLVVAIETAHYEDSVQRIASMSEDERQVFAEKLVKKMKEDEEQRRRIEADRARELRALAAKNDPGSGGKWYWNNEKARNEGFDEFKRQWGQRENEDDWRRSDKIVFASFKDPDADTLSQETVVTEPPVDSLTAEMLLARLPLTDSTLQGSRERMMSAYYDAGKIYQDQLHEKALAETQYLTILDKPFESEYKLLAAYQIYRLYDPAHTTALRQKEYILTNYPTSDYAGYLRDPDYFIKKKEREKLAEQEYLTDLDRFERGLHYPVLLKANQVIAEQKDNQFRSKYYLLKARSQAKLNEDKTTLLPTLDSLIAEYPGTPEAARAAEMKNIILNGYSSNEPADFTSKSVYKYEDGVPMHVIVFLPEAEASSTAKDKVSNFNREFFSRDKLNTSSKILGKGSVIVVKEFKSEMEAAKYVSTFKKTRKYLLDLQKAKIIYISFENMKTLFQTEKVADYDIFFEEYY